MEQISNFLLNLSIILVVIALLIALISIVRFASILIKLVALEVIVNLIIISLSMWALVHKQPLFIDICLALALVMFLSTVAYCQLLLRRKK